MSSPLLVELLEWADADARLSGGLGCFLGDYETVLLLTGDVVIEGDFFAGVRRLAPGAFDLIAVEGNLTVRGRIALYASRPGLLVTGTTTAHTLEGGDCEIYVGDGAFSCFVYGYYNDGILETGAVDTPWVINSNHDLRVSADGAQWIDTYGDDDEVDFGASSIAEAFVPEVRDDEGELDLQAFYERVLAGVPVLVPGARSDQAKALERARQARVDKQTELVMESAKLPSFPSDVLEMPWLRKLVLDGNALGRIPPAIGGLAELEVLSLADCGLSTLPDELGQLGALRVLRVANNSGTDEDFNAVPFTFPASVGALAALEELDVSGLSRDAADKGAQGLPERTRFVLPEQIAACTKLRVLIADGTNLELPRAAWGLPIEEVRMVGSSWSYLQTVPAFMANLRKLRRLRLGGNFFSEIPGLEGLEELEELDLDGSLCFLRRLPDFSRLPKLRVLRLSGASGRTDVPPPRIDRLLPLFEMRLDALEELSIDRWGGDGKPVLTAGHLHGLAAFPRLKRLNVAFDELTALPTSLCDKGQLEWIDVRYNRLGEAGLRKLEEAFPRATIVTG